MTVVMLLVCLGGFAGCNQAIPPQGEWVSFKSSDGKVDAKFPFKPKEKTEVANSPIGMLTVKMQLVETRKAAFIVSHLTYPVDPSEYDANAGLAGAVEGAAANISGTIVQSTDIEQSGFPGKEVLIRGKDDIYAKVRMYIDPNGPTLFQGLAVGDKEFAEGADTAFFLDSFKVQ